jgi:hypothetical protein
MSIRMGERKRGSTVLPARAQFRDGDRLGSMQRRDAGAIPKALSTLQFGRCHRAALYAARVLVGAGVSVTASDERGVSDPHLAAPFFAPWSGWRGSLTPNTVVTFVRTNLACPSSAVECAA